MPRNNLLLLTFSLVLGICACNYSKNVLLLSQGKLLRDDFREALPFHYEKGLILVEATIGSETAPRRFIFDTGAFESKVEKS